VMMGWAIRLEGELAHYLLKGNIEVTTSHNCLPKIVESSEWKKKGLG
jgi:hypothetical protein